MKKISFIQFVSDFKYKNIIFPRSMMLVEMTLMQSTESFISQARILNACV